MSIPTLVIAGTHSGVGKTSVALGVMRALSRQGVVVQPFKVGPDFIDPTHHRAATGRVSYNLDGWLDDRPATLAQFSRACAGAEVAIVEGATGLFDGWGSTAVGSTAELAAWLGAPIALVVDAGGVGRSLVATIAGFVSFDPAVEIAAVWCNRIGSPSHLQRIVATAADRLPGLPVAGLLRDRGLEIPSRHLGLHLADEMGQDLLDRLADWFEAAVDLATVRAIARPCPLVRVPQLLGEQGAGKMPNPQAKDKEEGAGKMPTPQSLVGSGGLGEGRLGWPTVGRSRRIGLAWDAAFCFYYAANLDWLRSLGAEWVEFSPLSDRLPPDLDALYLGGGYPELHGAALAANGAGRADILAFSEMKPVYGECGGLMALSQAIATEAGEFAAIGALPFAVQLTKRPVLGYTEVQTKDGLRGRGHRFHYSQIVWPGAVGAGVDSCYEVTTSRGDRLQEGYRVKQVLASYVHLYFAGNFALSNYLFGQIFSDR